MPKARQPFDPSSADAAALRELLRSVDWRSPFARNALEKAAQMQKRNSASIERLLAAADGRSYELLGRVESMQAHTRTALLRGAANWPASLPLPLEVELRELRELEGARLSLERSNSGAGAAQEPQYAATLHYRYGDRWVAQDEARERLEFIEEARQTTVHRDRRREQELELRLPAFGVFARAEYSPRRRTIWAAWFEGTRGEHWLLLAARLRDAGIEVDFGANFPLSLEAAPEAWYADLEESASNARFDLELGIRVGTEKVSLLPILVRALASRTLSLRPEPGEAPDATWLAPIDAQRRVPLPLARVRELVAPIVEWLEQTPVQSVSS